MTQFSSSSTRLVSISFALLAGLVVYLFVDMAKNAEIKHSCDALVQLRPRYLGHDRLAPDFDLSGLNGERIRLADFRNKVVILHFWTKTCAPCLDELPAVAEFAEQIKNRSDVALITITIDENPQAIADALQTVFGTKPASFPIAFDPENKVVLERYGTKYFPETWLLDTSHRIRARFDGIPLAGEGCSMMWKSSLLGSAINALKSPMICDLVIDPKNTDTSQRLLAPCSR